MLRRIFSFSRMFVRLLHFVLTTALFCAHVRTTTAREARASYAVAANAHTAGP